MKLNELSNIVKNALEDLKVLDLKILDVSDVTDVMDIMVVGSGNSNRHVKSLSEKVIEVVKKAGIQPLGIEGQQEGEWVLIDIGDIVVHVMLPQIRDFYNLEKLWEAGASKAQKSS